jgi:galactoside O-acetyltransferase
VISHLANLVGNGIKLGNNCRIDPFVTITGYVTIGDNVHIGVGVCIFGGGGVIIGDKVSLSPGCKIFSTNEDADSGYLSNPTLEDSHAHTAPVIIGNRSVIGSNSVVLPGLVIGDDVQVGALSLVKQDLASGFIYAGIPAKALREKPQLIERKHDGSE